MSRSFLDLDLVDGAELRGILTRAGDFKAGDPTRPMAGKMLAMIWQGCDWSVSPFTIGTLACSASSSSFSCSSVRMTIAST